MKPEPDPAENGAHMIGLWLPVAGILFIIAVAFLSALVSNCHA